jgi:flagellar biosynthesis protein FlhB
MESNGILSLILLIAGLGTLRIIVRKGKEDTYSYIKGDTRAFLQIFFDKFLRYLIIVLFIVLLILTLEVAYENLTALAREVFNLPDVRPIERR